MDITEFFFTCYTEYMKVLKTFFFLTLSLAVLLPSFFASKNAEPTLLSTANADAPIGGEGVYSEGFTGQGGGCDGGGGGCSE